MYDQNLLYALKTLRMLAYGQTTIILVPFFAATGATDSQVGLFMALTLIGDVLVSVIVTGIADKCGRRLMLALSSILMCLSGLVFAYTHNFWFLLAAAIIGVISPSGDEVGPFRAIEESAIAHLTPFSRRATVFGIQNLCGSLGLSLGSFTGGRLDDYIASNYPKEGTKRYRYFFLLYSVWGLLSLLVVCLMSDKVDLHEGSALPETEPLLCPGDDPDVSELPVPIEEPIEPSANRGELNKNHHPEGAVLKLSLYFFFGIDSLAYSFMTTPWLVEYFFRRFKVSSSFVGDLLLFAQSISALSSPVSAYVTHLIGAVPAIGVTKIASGLFAGIMPLAKSSMQAGSYTLARSIFDTMDVVPRQVFLTSIVKPEDRTSVLGAVNVVKTLARSVGPVFTGILAERSMLYVCFEILCGLEWLFALLVMVVFR